ncbi:MAG: LuxR C-terminal-related transcriptional regulator [Proteiniphilum sp.]|jgi:DNA-binding CsgD family transcriptional regulator|nr:LuxR C-terminal-related transcriptional regulator [Proteiniphilum sp.]
MDIPSILCDKLVDFKAIPDHNAFTRGLNIVHSLAKATQTTALIIDHFEKCTWLYHYNPEYIGVFGSMRHELYKDNYFDTLVCAEDADLFSQTVSAINDCIRTDFLKGDRHYYFSFKIRLGPPREEAQICSLIVIPFIYTPDLTYRGAIYYIGATKKLHPGNLVLHAFRQNAFFNFNTEENRFNTRAKVGKLSDVEKKILKLAAEGVAENEIAEMLGLPVSNLKNQKTRMFNRLSVSSIAAAIALAYNQELLD